METSLQTGFAQIFSCCPKKLSCPKFVGAAAPLRPLGRYAYGSIDIKFIFDNARLGLSSSANNLQTADVALRVVFLLFLPRF